MESAVDYEKYAHSLVYKQGKCKNTSFAHGGHRVGIIPIVSVLDGGLQGDSCREICVDCGKWMKATWFLPIKQPSRILKEAK